MGQMAGCLNPFWEPPLLIKKKKKKCSSSNFLWFSDGPHENANYNRALIRPLLELAIVDFPYFSREVMIDHNATH